jgi:hypothetical protein
MLLGQRLPGGAHRVDRVALATAAGWPLGPVDLDHPLATVDQQPRQPGAVAARTLDRKHRRPGTQAQAKSNSRW